MPPKSAPECSERALKAKYNWRSSNTFCCVGPLLGPQGSRWPWGYLQDPQIITKNSKTGRNNKKPNKTGGNNKKPSKTGGNNKTNDKTCRNNQKPCKTVRNNKSSGKRPKSNCRAPIVRPNFILFPKQCLHLGFPLVL